MYIREIMTSDPACCIPEADLQRVSRLMMENDCGAVPVVRSGRSKELIGIVTDRDIVCRVVGRGENPLEKTARDAMTQPVLRVNPSDTVEDCRNLMEKNKVRRVPVVDDGNGCVGIVAQADLARHRSRDEAGELVEEVSEPTASASSPSSHEATGQGDTDLI